MVENPLDVFPVWVSLTSFFPCDDTRARCLMSAARGRTSRWLARRLRRTLQLPTRVSLRVRGHLLPPAEPLALLQSGDTLEAIPAIDGVVDISREVSPSLLTSGRARKRRYTEDPPADSAGGRGLGSAETPAALPSPLPAPLVALPASSPVVQGSVSVYEDAESLVEMKRRALHLLEHHVEPEGGAAVGGAAGGRSKRRRRVRRRRPPPTPVFEPPPTPTPAPVPTRMVFTSSPPLDTDPPAPASSSPHSEECESEPAVDAPEPPRDISIVSPVVETGGAVVRGGAAGGAARCVRALAVAAPSPSPARGSSRDEPLPPLDISSKIIIL